MLKERLINYFRKGEKTHESFNIGVRFEHFVVEEDTLKAVPFKGEKGIETLFREFEKRGWQSISEENNLIGIKKDEIIVSLNPGLQLVVNLNNAKSILEIEQNYLSFLDEFFPLLEERNQLLISLGYQPVNKIKDIENLPEKKYEYMYKYFEDKNSLVKNMMKGTAVTEVTINYAHQDDFRKKYQVVYSLIPVISALFDNSPFFEGEEYKEHCLRNKLRNNCDDQRCIIENVLKKDFGYKDYAEFVLKSQPIFITKDDGYIYTGNKSVEELFKDRELTEKDIEHVLNMVLTDIRLKESLEIRIADALPYPLNFAYIALLKGLIYSQENLDALYEYVYTIKEDDIIKAKEEIIFKGMDAKIGKGTIRDLAKDLFFMAGNFINPQEAHYLQPLEYLIFHDISPKDISKRKLFTAIKR